MHVTKKQISPTNVQLTITGDADQLVRAKQAALQELGKELKIQGFRKGHAPAAIVEKSIDRQVLQTRIIDTVVNDIYAAALQQEKLRPAAQPEVNLTKFVPDTTLEVTASVDVLGEITLPDYKKFKLTKKIDPVTDGEVEAVLDDLRARGANKQEIQQAAADGNEVTIDFEGTDAKTKQPIDGASGKDYPLTIGSNTFIPGFEPQLIGMKAGSNKSFDVTFPADYSAKALQNKKVTFAVTVSSVKHVELPKLDAAFAATVGPFKTVASLRADIRKQLAAEKDAQAQRAFENDLLTMLGEKTQLEIPDSMVEQELDRMDEEEKRNLIYRGQTWQEHLAAEGKTEEQHRASHREDARMRIKIGVALGEVAEREQIQVAPEELEQQLKLLQDRYKSDTQMQAELAKPENQRDIASRLLTEKAVAALAGYAAK